MHGANPINSQFPPHYLNHDLILILDHSHVDRFFAGLVYFQDEEMRMPRFTRDGKATNFQRAIIAFDEHVQEVRV
jgi:hypothetical protein